MKIRNPWGDHEWNGDWGKESSLWTEELKELVDFVEVENGIFYMTFTDFQEYFKYAHICKFRDDYKFDTLRIEASVSEKEYHLINMTSLGD